MSQCYPRPVNPPKSKCTPTNPLCLPYQMEWSKGDTGPPGITGVTGPTGQSDTELSGIASNTQPMEEEYVETNIVYSTPLSNQGAAIVSIVSDDPYFSERFQSLSVTNKSTTGFTAITKMQPSYRVVVDEADNTVLTYSSMVILTNGAPAVLYCKNDGSNINVMLSRLLFPNTEGEWVTTLVAEYGSQPTIGQLLTVTYSKLGFFVQDSSSIHYQGSTVNTGNPGSWVDETVFTTTGGDTTTSMASCVLSTGFPAVAVGITGSGGSSLDIIVTDGVVWQDVVISTDDPAKYPLALIVQSDGTPAVVDYDGAVLEYYASTQYDGTLGWTTHTIIETSASIDATSVVAFVIDANGLPAVFYKTVGQNGVTLAVNSSIDGSGTWTLYSIISTLPQFPSNQKTLFPINLLSGNIGLMYTRGDTLNFATTTISLLGTWTSILSDDTLPGTGYNPSGVIALNNGYLSAAYTSYDDVASIIYGKSAILDNLVIVGTTPFTLPWSSSST